MTFGRYSIDSRTRALLLDGRAVDLQQQPFELLMLLVENADSVVGRDSIRARLWPDTTVEYDQSINYAVRQIRLALGDEANRLQTVPRHGYRFVGPVNSSVGRPVARKRVRGFRGRHVVAMAAVLAIAFGAGLVAGHTDSGAFVYEHIVHPDRCPYVRMFLHNLRNS